MASTVVIGGGVGGLATAIRLRSSGHDVTVVEKNHVGGKLATREVDGFRFDTGPSLLTLPHVFGDLFSAAGRRLRDYVRVVKLDAPFEYRYPDGANLRTYDEPEQTFDAFDQFFPGSGDQWLQFQLRGERIWNISERTFFAGPMDSWKDLVRRMRSPRDLFDIDALMTLSGRSEQTFNDSRLQAWANRYATYSGSNPFSAPATLACIPFIEQQFGCWHVVGGLGNLGVALRKLCEELGVAIHEGVAVERVVTRNGAVAGVRTTAGDIRADVVVSNVDAHVLYDKLLPDSERSARLAKVQRSSSVMALELSLAGTTPDATHHTVWFAQDQEREFRTIFRDASVSQDCTVYACNPVVTDPTMAPADREAWTVLVNVGAGARADWQGLAASVMDRMGVTGRVLRSEMTTPQDLEDRFGDVGGSIYGTSSNGIRSAFLRAANRGPVRGLYLVGGSAHPGGGLPLVAMSAQIVAAMIDQDSPS